MDRARVLLMRHGRSTWNLEGRWQGQADPPLAPEGVEEVEAVLRRGLPFAPQLVLSSDLRRARDSAARVAAAFGAPHEVDRRLRERSVGVFAGQTRESLRRLPPGPARAFLLDRSLAPPGGESLKALRARVVSFLDELPDRLRGRRALVVTHRGVLRVILGEGAILPPAGIHALPERWLRRAAGA